MLLIATTGRTVNVRPYSKEYDPITNVPIATAATAWDDPTTGLTYCLVLHECLFFGDRLKHSLLNPNQLRCHGIRVDDTPRQFDPRSLHAIVAMSPPLTIPLALCGVISGFPCRKPTQAEWDDCARIELTSDLEWQPYSDDFAETERHVATHHVAAVVCSPVSVGNIPDDRYVSSMSRMALSHSLLELDNDPDSFLDRLVSQVTVASDDLIGDGLDGHVDDVVYPLSQASCAILALTTALPSLRKYCHAVGILESLQPSVRSWSPLKQEYGTYSSLQTVVHVNASTT